MKIYVIKKQRHYFQSVLNVGLKQIPYYTSDLLKATIYDDIEKANSACELANKTEDCYSKCLKGKFKVITYNLVKEE